MKNITMVDRSKYLADKAVEALMEEALLTPKPGLVDRRDTGSHSDMNLDLMLKSAASLQETFYKIGEAAWSEKPTQKLREKIARIGRKGEYDMLKETKGVNTHKGAIWAIGLLTAASAIKGPEADAGSITDTAAQIARFDDRYAPVKETNGEKAIKKYQVRGAKGQAQQGFPHVIDIGLPALLQYREAGHPEEQARLYSLISMMAYLDDTCLLHRGGSQVLEQTKERCRKILLAGGPASGQGWRHLLQLNNYLIEENASPGGSADLLAAVLFIDSIQIRLSRYKTELQLQKL
ncbi:triphosphoribosyl-dephospho-CoA synthase [Thalassobacillus sp. C254]|uniref:triphosphoribosyl-dephospho-CoA synthase n=1 Tax=Thalassobacillus sp. C254 TaxID=1225341 RepID=UPI0006D1AD21|nr:triphosphoribosyl-dephospho-CoA synthase [Thalassobacillus sp. C254]